MKNILHVDNPRVALANNGTEETKERLLLRKRMPHESSGL